MTNRNTRLTIFLALGSLALSQIAKAVVPAPDGGYPGGNTAEGQNALLSLTTGGFNTAVGFLSLRSDTTGSFNTAVGAGTLLANTADQNTATGTGALLSNTGGAANTADGAFALFSNSTGFHNSAFGSGALMSNTGGQHNTAMGFDALVGSTGNYNTALGAYALAADSTGNANTAVGNGALANNSSGFNTAVGFQALVNCTTGTQNIALGESAGADLTTGSNNIHIGHHGYAGQNNTINIGVFGTHTATFIAGIHGASTVSGIPVYIDTFGQLGTQNSSRRFKKEIKPMDKASEGILSLKPVTFRYKSGKTNMPEFGLIAEEVAEVNPDLVVRDKDGEIYTVRYDAVNAMLLNEFLKEHQTVKGLKATIAQQKQQIDALTAGLQKVSAQIEMSKLPPQVASNDP